MELRLALTCDDARMRPDGKLDLAGVFNELSAPGFPALQERMTVVFIIEWSDGETGTQSLRADLVDDEDRRVLTIEGHTEVTSREAAAAPQTRLIMPLNQVVFPHRGDYHFDLIAGGETRRACSVFVDERPE